MMDIKTTMQMNRAVLGDALSVQNGMKNLDATTVSDNAKTEAAPRVSSIQEETSAIKNTNDLFGYLKKSEKALNAIEGALAEKGADAFGEIEQIMATTTYKEQPIFQAIRSGESTIDLSAQIGTLMAAGDTEGLASLIEEQKASTGEALAAVKQQLLGNSASLDRHITTDIETIKRDIESMSPVSDVNSPDMLRDKLKALLG